VKIFAVPSPAPIVSPPARVRSLGYATIALTAPRAGAYHLSVTYTPYWQSQTACLQPAADGMTRLVVLQPGIVRLRFAVTPARVLDALTGEQPERCR
jgi:hypothetical protein